jgi:hypothetical protein
VPFGLILLLLILFTTEDTELTESFSLGNIFKKKEKMFPIVGRKYLEKLKTLPSGIFLIGRLCLRPCYRAKR